MLYLFSFSRYETKCVIKFLLRQFNLILTYLNFKIYVQSTFKAIADRGKRGEDRNRKN